MNLQFDHVIHYVDDAYSIMNEFIEQGFHTVYGGRHEKRGSYNTLLHFGIGYIEFLGIDDFDLFDKVGARDVTYSPFSSIARDHFTEGFAKVCIRTKNLEKLAETFKAKGLEVNGPVPLSRKRPDGKLLQWSLLFVGDKNSDLPLPFFIDWHETDEERITGLKDAEVIAPHRAGEFTVDHVTMAVHDAAKTASQWAEWFDLTLIDNYRDEELQAHIHTLQLPGGNLRFAQPTDTGITQDALDQRGERPFQLTVQGSNGLEDIKVRGGHYTFTGGKKDA